MAGGKGTRLVALTKDEIPKPMAPVAGRPIIEWQLSSLKENGITDIIIAAGHLGGKIEEYFGDGGSFGVRLRYHHEAEPLGSAGSLHYIRSMLNEGPFLLTFGDLIFDVDIGRMERFHREKGAEATLFVHPNSHPYDSDLVLAGADGRVTGFEPKGGDRSGRWYDNRVNAGLYILDKAFCRRISEPRKTDLEKDLLHPMAEKGERLYAYASTEYVKDAGTPERIKSAEAELLSGFAASRNLKNRQKAVFLDRDGTLNVYRGLIWRHEDFELYPFAAEAVGRLNRSGYLAIVVTNQPSVARGLCRIEDIDLIHKKMQTLLGREGVFLDDVRFCPHHPDKGYPEENPVYKIECPCRKPGIGLISECTGKYNIDLSQSWLVGDTTTDIRTARNAGLRSVLLLTGEAGKDGKYPDKPDYICRDLLEAAELIGGM